MSKNEISKERENRIQDQLKSIPEEDYEILYEKLKNYSNETKKIPL
jgi:hypothetical protein